MSYRTLLQLIIVTLLSSSLSHAADVPQSFTLDGKLFSDAAGTTALQDSAIAFTVQILDDSKTCVIYEESQSVNTASSKGYFSIQVGTELGSLLRTSGDSANTMAQVFQNISLINGKLLSNGNPCTVPPTGGSRRYVRIKILPASMGGVARTLLPDLTIDSVPNAVVAERAETLQGLRANNVLQVNTASGNQLTQTNLESLFTSATRFNSLTAVVDGTSTNYMRSNSAAGAQLPVMAGAPTGPSPGSIWFDTSDSRLKYQTSGGPISVGSGSGTVTSVGFTAPTELSVAGAPITTSGTIAVTWATQTTNKVFAAPDGATGTPSFRVMTANDIPNLPWSKITTGTPTTLLGYGITDAVKNAGGSPSLQSGLDAAKGAATTAGRVWISTDTKQIYRDNGATWDLIGSGAAGGVTSVTSTNSYLSVATGTTTPALTVNVGTAANTVAAGNDSRITGALQAATAFTGDVSGVYSATSVDKIKGTGVAITALGTGNFLRYNGTNWVNTNLSSGDVTTGLGFTPVNKAGDTMTGLLVLSADPSANLGAATKQYVDSAASTAQSNAQTYADTKFITKTLPAAPGAGQNGQSIRWNNGTSTWEYYTAGSGGGDFMANGSVPMTGSLKMGGNTIYGNSTASGNLTLDSTSNATKGDIVLAPSGGSVGIGVANPTNMLDVGDSGGNVAFSVMPLSNGIAALQVYGRDPSSGGAIMMSDQSAIALNSFDRITIMNPADSSGVLQIANGSAGVIETASNGPLTITTGTGPLALNPSTSGGVGIGTNTPNTKLDVSGAINVREMTAAAAGLSVADQGRIYFDSVTNKFKVSENGGAYVDLVGGGGTVTSVSSTNSYLSVATGTTTPALTLNVGTAANTVAAGNDSRITGALQQATAFSGDVSGAYNATSVDKIKGTAVTITSLTSGNFLKYNGTAWVNSNLAAGDITGALTYTPVNKAGDTMTGLLVLSADPSANLGAATKQYVDSSTSTAAANYLLKDGTVALTADWDVDGAGAGTRKITGLAAPTAGDGAATKTYADTKFITKTLPAAPTVAENGQSLRWNNGSNTWEYYTAGSGGGDFMASGSVPMTGSLKLGGNTVYGNSTASGNLTLDSTSSATKGNVFLAPSGGVVGIGTTSPVGALHVVTTGGSTDLMLQSSGNNDWNGNFIDFWRSRGTTASPAANIAGDLIMGLEAQPWKGDYSYSWTQTPASIRVYAEGTISSSSIPLSIRMTTTASGSTTPVERFTILPNGNVGIGSTTPATVLDVNGATTFRGVAAASAPPTAAQGKIYYDSTANKFKVSENNGAYVDLVGGGGSVTSVSSTNSYLSVATGTTTPALTLNVGTAANTVAAGNDSRITGALQQATAFSGDVSGAYNATSVDKIKGTAVTITSLTSGNFLKYNGTAWVNSNLAAGDITGALTYTPVNKAGDTMTGLLVLSADPAANLGAATKQYVDSAASTAQSNAQTYADTKFITKTLPAAPGAGQNGQSIRWNNGSSVWEYYTAGSGGGDFMKDGSVAMTGTLKMGGNAIYGNSTASGNLTLESTSNATKGYVNLQPNGGNVGVGTATPTALMHLKGHANNTLIVESDDPGSTSIVVKNTSAGGHSFEFFSTGASGATPGVFGVYDQTLDKTNLAIFGSSGDIGIRSGSVLGWSSDPSYAGEAANDTGLTRLSAGKVAVGDGTAGNTTGTLVAAKVGVGSSTPATTLDINGATTFRGVAAASAPPTAAQGKIYFDSTANKFKVSENNGAYVDLVGGGGSVTSVSSTNSYLSVATGTTTPALTLNVGTAANTVAAGNDSRITGALQQATAFSGDVSGAYNATSVDKIKGTAVTITSLTSGNFLKYNGTAWVNSNLAAGDITGALTYTPVNKAGDTMTGLLVLSADPAANLGAATKQYVDSAASTAQSNAQTYADTKFITKTLPAAPGAGQNGQSIRWNNGSNVWEYYTAGSGGGDFMASGSVPMTGTLKMGGNTIYGNSTSAGNLTLESTSHATKGNILLATGTTGNVGIGTTTPLNRLHVEQNSNAENGVSVYNTTNGTGSAATYRAYSSGAGYAEFGAAATGHTWASGIMADRTFIYSESTNGMALVNFNAAPIVFGVNSLEKMRIDSTGKVGIGTTAPATTLDVNGGVTFRGSAAASSPATAAQGKIYFDSTANKFKVSENNGAYVDLVGGGGTVTSVSSTNSYLSVATGTTTPALTLNVGTAANTVAAGNDSRITGAFQAATAFTGDVSGVYSATSVDKIKGTGVAITTLTTGNFLRYNGTNWVNTLLSSGDVTTGLGYTPVNKAGDTMTGLLVLSADPGANLGAATKQYVDSSTSTAAANYLRKDATVALTADWDVDGAGAGTRKITGLAAPTAGDGAVTKTYHDTTFITKTLPAAPGAGQNGQTIRWNNGTSAWEYFTAAAGADFYANGTVPMTGTLKMGGNTIYGNSTASGNLTLESTSNATKGYVNLQPNGGYVGIGTATPVINLDMRGNIAGDFGINIQNSNSTSGPMIALSTDRGYEAMEIWANGSAASGWGGVDSFNLFNGQNGPMNFWTNATVKMTLDSTGAVGMGTTTPTERLDVTAANQAGIAVTSTTAGASDTAIKFNTPDRKWSFGSNIFAVGVGKFSIFDVTALATRLVIDTSGNVGINQTSPGAVLDVAGTVKLGSAGTVVTGMGVCTVASYTPTSSTTNVTCTGVPASTAVAVNCSASAAFQTPATTTIYARATGTANQIAVNLSAANNVVVTLKCMWMQ